MSNPPPPRIFLSRTTAGLGALAEKVATALKERGFEIIHQPDFGLQWRRIRHMLMEKIREADAVLCLVGPVYGFAPRTTIPEFRDPNTGREQFSYAQIEYRIARSLHKPVVTILVPEACCTFVRPEDRGTPEQRQLQTDFIRDFIQSDEHVYHEFTCEADLLGAIRSSLITIPEALLPTPAPENIPFASIGTLFTARGATLRELRESLVSAGNGEHGPSNRPAVQLIHGTGGVGKTRLAVEYAYAHAPDYTARLFVRGAATGALDESLASLAGLFILNLEEQEEQETAVRIAAVIRWLAEHPGYLLVIDNVDTDEARDHVVNVLSQLPAGHVLITSRLHTWPGDIRRTPLDVFSDTDSCDLLFKYRTSPKAPVPDADRADALLLARDLDGLALALEQAAAYLNVVAVTVAEYHERWKSNAARVRQWHDPAQMGYPVSVAATWQTSFEQLTPASQHLLNLLSWLAPNPVPRFLLKTLAERKLSPDPLSGADPYRALGELIHFSLAKSSQKGAAFSVHRLIQQVTREGQEPPLPAPALSDSMEWVACDMPAQPGDVRTWPVAVPLIPHAVAAAEFAADRGIPNPSWHLLNCATVFLVARADYRTAEPLIRRALELAEACYGSNHPNVATLCGSLSIILERTNRRAEAERQIQRALTIDERRFGPNHPRIAIRLESLAELLRATNRAREAEPLYRRALAIAESFFQDTDPRLGSSLNNLAELLRTTNRHREAETLYSRAIAVLEAGLGPDHPQVATTLNNLGLLFHDTRRFAEAETFFQRALKIDEAVYGGEHPDVARDLNNLARLFQSWKRFPEAESLYRRALAIYEACLVPYHPDTRLTLANLATLLVDTGRFEEGESIHRRLLAEHDESTGDRSQFATDLNNLAYLLILRGRHAEAEPVLWQALAVSEESFGKTHPEVARVLMNLVAQMNATNRRVEAVGPMQRALSIFENSFGESHPEVLGLLDQIADVLQNLGQSRDAEPLMRRALAITEKLHGDRLPDIINRLHALVKLLWADNRRAETESLMQRQLGLIERLLGADHPNNAALLNNIAQVMHADGRLAEAEPLMRRSLAIYRNTFGDDHPNVAVALASIANLLESLGRVSEAVPLMREHLEILIRNSRDTGRRHPDLEAAIENYMGLLAAAGDTPSQALVKVRTLMAQHGT